MSLRLEQNNEQEKHVLSENPMVAFAHAKAERLAAAVHMVTRFMDIDEPLRKSLRRESLKVLSRIFTLEESAGESVKSLALRVISLLDIAYRTQYISEMNWRVIRNEYASFIAFVEERNINATHDGEMISKEYFDVEEPKAVEAPKAHIVYKPRPIQKQKDKPALKGQTRTTPGPKAKSPIIKERKNGRREAILKLLKLRKKVGVRDVAEVVSGVSEKTLQRELISLVDEGILKKEGERRWSTYTLA
jgi:DNA-binding transcriptional ArsR family regulator